MAYVIFFSPLPNDKILDQSKLKAAADNITNAIQKLEFVLGRVKNIVGKGENAGYQKTSFLGSFKVANVW